MKLNMDSTNQTTEKSCVKERAAMYHIHVEALTFGNLQEFTVGQKFFSQPPIVQLLPLKKMREACNIHHRYTSTMRDQMGGKESRKSQCRIFYELIGKFLGKISILSPTNKQDFWLSQTCNFFRRVLCPPLVTCINGTCLNSLSV